MKTLADWILYKLGVDTLRIAKLEGRIHTLECQIACMHRIIDRNQTCVELTRDRLDELEDVVSDIAEPKQWLFGKNVKVEA